MIDDIYEELANQLDHAEQRLRGQQVEDELTPSQYLDNAKLCSAIHVARARSRALAQRIRREAVPPVVNS